VRARALGHSGSFRGAGWLPAVAQAVLDRAFASTVSWLFASPSKGGGDGKTAHERELEQEAARLCVHLERSAAHRHRRHGRAHCHAPALTVADCSCSPAGRLIAWQARADARRASQLPRVGRGRGGGRCALSHRPIGPMRTPSVAAHILTAVRRRRRRRRLRTLVHLCRRRRRRRGAQRRRARGCLRADHALDARPTPTPLHGGQRCAQGPSLTPPSLPPLQCARARYRCPACPQLLMRVPRASPPAACLRSAARHTVGTAG
jgi:hypothetical protein